MKIVIIGNGIAGSTAARFIRKNSDHEIVMISGETEYPFSRTALMYIYMGHVRRQDTKLYEDYFWDKNRIQRIYNWVEQVDVLQKTVLLKNNQSIKYDKLILATGSQSNKFGWPGQELKGVQGLYHMQDLDQMEKYSSGLNRAVIVGGGLIGIEMAEMFHSRHIPVTMLVRESSFWNNVLPIEESMMINTHIKSHGIDLRLDAELKEIKGDANGCVQSVQTKKDEIIECGFVGLTAGVSPNVSLAKKSGIECNRGILVDAYLQTSIEDVYALGDCAELRSPKAGRRSIEAVWYTGKMMGQTVAQTIGGTPLTYDPGTWYNSAKFFDIEYQVYGDVPNLGKEGIESMYWQHPTENKSIRINFEIDSKRVTGFNLMGIRYRQEVCIQWIETQTKIEQVLSQLSLANFDPELSREYEQELIRLYNQKTGSSIQSSAKRSLRSVLQFLQP